VQLSPLFSTAARAPQPVWRGSTAAPVKFSPTPRKTVARWYRLVRAWKRVLKGILWRAVDRVYEALISFLNYTTGQLDPSIDAIAERSGYSPRHVVTALKVLRELRVIVRIRRYEEYRDDSGRHHLRQIRNAYSSTAFAVARLHGPVAAPARAGNLGRPPTVTERPGRGGGCDRPGSRRRRPGCPGERAPRSADARPDRTRPAGGSSQFYWTATAAEKPCRS
jgi:hypothetical protein